MGGEVGVGMLKKGVVARMDVVQRSKKSFIADGSRVHMQQSRRQSRGNGPNVTDIASVHFAHDDRRTSYQLLINTFSF
jgi:hypothetical protein